MKNKKINLLLFMMIMIMVLTGCNSSEKINEENLETQENQTEEVISDNILIRGKYFNVTIPEEWNDKYHYEEIEDEYGYYMGFYEKDSYYTEYGGWLFSICISGEEEFLAPSYNYIGNISIDNKEKLLLAIWPTDVQFKEENAEKYMEMYEDAEDIINSVESSGKSNIEKSKDIFGYYILPGSDMRYVNDIEVEYLDKETLKLARNEIYARHGLIFKSLELKEYFADMEWYSESESNQDNIKLNVYEKANIELIKKYEKSGS